MRAPKMPGSGAADLEEALNKKGGLSLSQLANYDDLITDALVDRVRLRPSHELPLHRDEEEWLTVSNTGVLLVIDSETQSQLPRMSWRPREGCVQDYTRSCNH